MGLHIGGGVGPVRYSKRLGGRKRPTRQRSVEETAATIRYAVTYYLPACLLCFIGFLFGTSGAIGASFVYAVLLGAPVSLVLAIVAAVVRAVRRRT